MIAGPVSPPLAMSSGVSRFQICLGLRGIVAGEAISLEDWVNFLRKIDRLRALEG
jgi:hypothetical protein